MMRFSFGRVGACACGTSMCCAVPAASGRDGLLATMQMIIWGFFSTFLYQNSTWLAGAFGVLLAAVMLWDVLFRGQLGFSLSFLEELWARNLANLYCSPLTPSEHVVSLFIMALIRALIGVVPAMLLAIPFYHFSIFGLACPWAPSSSASF